PNLASLTAFQIRLEEIEEAVAGAVKNTSGGYMIGEQHELTIRNIGQTVKVEDIAATVIKTVDGAAILLSDVANVRFGTQIMRGDAAVNGTPGVILGIEKNPNANTLTVTEAVEKALVDLAPALPDDLVISTVFRQANFIERAVENLIEAVRDGAFMVVIVLVFFLMNMRTTLITLTAIPLSFALTAIVFSWLDMSINAMTLGGLAVALGMVVDDAIVDVENVYRRLKENRFAVSSQPVIRVVADASKEVRSSILYATLLVILVFLPLLALESVEGRLFAPIAVATIVSLAASFLVSLTVVPVLCFYLLPKMKHQDTQDGFLVRWLKWADEKFLLQPALDHPWLTLLFTAMLFGGAVGLWPLMGKQFLPPFNEGSFLFTMVAPPGTSLPRSREIGAIAEKELAKVERIEVFSRRTGRAEKAEHVMSVNVNEFDIELKPDTEHTQAVINEVRDRLSKIPGVLISPGQPIQHRIDHMLSGVQAQIALKIFGPDFQTLRDQAERLAELIRDVPELTDVNVEPQVMIPQIQVEPDRLRAQATDMRAGALNERLNTLLGGKKLGEIRDGILTRDIVLWLPENARDSAQKIRSLWVESESGVRLPLGEVAEVRVGEGPNVINREGTQRRIVVSANSSASDLTGVVDEIRRRIDDPALGLRLPQGYYLTYEGQYKNQQQASRRLAILSGMTFIGMIFLLYSYFQSVPLVAQVLLNIPLAVMGGIALTWHMIGTISVATLVGFITLAGIASRNTIMMISHYLHLMEEEGERFNRSMIVRGSLERLVPVTMTALAAGLALVPLALSANEPGKEILYPVAVAILGGLLSSTLLDMVVTPCVFYHFGRNAAQKWIASRCNQR
ncbi:MAG: efflux RND transporter permease subunit, partial [Candidatus Tectomicrobia bacterium]|nr:efflux RND transporter permease subunit [Candidatus Tectomicrobia bacterium]